MTEWTGFVNMEAIGEYEKGGDATWKTLHKKEDGKWVVDTDSKQPGPKSDPFNLVVGVYQELKAKELNDSKTHESFGAADDAAQVQSNMLRKELNGWGLYQSTSKEGVTSVLSPRWDPYTPVWEVGKDDRGPSGV